MGLLYSLDDRKVGKFNRRVSKSLNLSLAVQKAVFATLWAASDNYISLTRFEGKMKASGRDEKQVLIDEATVTLRQDGIIHVLFHRNVNLDLPLQMLLLNIYKEVAAGVPRPFLFEAMQGVRVTREARENALRIEDESPAIAYAVIAPTVAYRLIAKFYVSIRKPKRPYRVFSKQEAAVKWLRSFVE
jgi:hypothetical protein